MHWCLMGLGCRIPENHCGIEGWWILARRNQTSDVDIAALPRGLLFTLGAGLDFSGALFWAGDSGSGPKPKKAPGKCDLLGFCFGLRGLRCLF